MSRDLKKPKKLKKQVILKKKVTWPWKAKNKIKNWNNFVKKGHVTFTNQKSEKSDKIDKKGHVTLKNQKNK